MSRTEKIWLIALCVWTGYITVRIVRDWPNVEKRVQNARLNTGERN